MLDAIMNEETGIPAFVFPFIDGLDYIVRTVCMSDGKGVISELFPFEIKCILFQLLEVATVAILYSRRWSTRTRTASFIAM